MKNDQPVIRLFVIEDNAAIIVPGLRNLFRRDRDGIRVSGFALNVEEAIANAGQDGFDVIILDLWIANSEPLDNLLKVKTRFPDKPVIIYTQDTSMVWRRKMMEAGAKGYLIKDASREEMKLAFVRIAAGDTWVSGRFSDAEQEGLFRTTRGSAELSSVHRQMADLLSRGRSREEIAKQLDLSKGTIDKSFAKLRTEFRVKSNPELIRALIERGLL